jgi:hypothetical protein
MVFSARSSLPNGAAELRSVRRSLNMPITAVAKLPIGPASAAIAIHADSDGGAAHWTLAVRSERTREIVYFTAREPFEESRVLADAALSLADGMGFLFEEQVLEAARSAADCEARRAWQEFLETDRSLDELGTRPTSLPRSDVATPEVAAPNGVGLTKFRWALKPAEPNINPAGGTTSDGGSSASRRASRPAGKKWTWKELLWRSTD